MLNGYPPEYARTKEARLRVSVLATHKREQLESLVNTLNDINKNIKIK